MILRSNGRLRIRLRNAFAVAEDKLVRLRDTHAHQKTEDERLRLQIKEEHMSKTLVEERLDRHLNEACATRVVTEGELGQRIEDMGKELSKTRERLADTKRAATELKNILEIAQ